MFHELVLLAMAGAEVFGAAPPPAPHSILELRQYKIVRGRRDDFIALFEECFIESQEADGMRLVGQFRDENDPDRFVWIRTFADMPSRGTELTAFYTGPTWLANRDRANAMLDDNDNVLLLRPLSPNLAFAAAQSRPAVGAKPTSAKIVIAVIEYLWKTPQEGFSSFFATKLLPAISTSGLDVLGAYVPEEAQNNFPRLPVRPDRKILVWFAAAPDKAGVTRSLNLLRRAPQNAELMDTLRDFQERAPQILWLRPTARSALR